VCAVDIIFVMDKSRSDSFEDIQTIVAQLVARFDIESDLVRVGIVTYSNTIKDNFNLNSNYSVGVIQQFIYALTESSGVANTHLAFEYVRTTMLTEAAGDRGDVPNVIVHFTSSTSQQPALTQVCTGTYRYVHVDSSCTFYRSQYQCFHQTAHFCV